MRWCVVLPLLALVGCANGRVSEQDDVRGTVRTFLDQCAEQRVLHVLPELVPAGQKVVAHASTTAKGCARVLGVPPAIALAPEDFTGSTLRVVAFDGARARVEVELAGLTRSVVLSRGEQWRIEGP